MGNYSDPTAAMAMGNLNREYTYWEKKAKHLCELYEKGKISRQDLERAQAQFKGLYRHVLTDTLERRRKNASK